MTKYFEECGFIAEITKEDLKGKFAQIPKTVSVPVGSCGVCNCTDDKEQED